MIVVEVRNQWTAQVTAFWLFSDLTICLLNSLVYWTRFLGTVYRTKKQTLQNGDEDEEHEGYEGADCRFQKKKKQS